MTDAAPIVTPPVASEFDRLVAGARSEIPRARSAWNGVRAWATAVFARMRPASPVAPATAATTVIQVSPARRIGVLHTLLLVGLAALAFHQTYRAGERHERALQEARWAGQEAATKAITDAAAKRADAAEARAKDQTAALDDYAQKLAAKPAVETVTVTKEIPVTHEVTRNVFVPHETVRTVVLAGRPAAGGGCALSDDDVRRLRAFAPDAPARR